MITVSSRGSFDKTERFLQKLARGDIFARLDHFGLEGVNALAAATPVDSGKTASSWDYEVRKTKDSYSITWYNRDEIAGLNVAIMLQYGHGTGTGGYVEGRDYINPVIKPLFDRIAEEVRKEVASL